MGKGRTTPAAPAAKRAFWLPTFGKGIPWLLYVALALPAVLWIVAFLLDNGGIATFFHVYLSYVVSPAPVGIQGGAVDLFFRTGTGIPGLLLYAYAVARAIVRRDRWDAVLCAAFALAMFAFFFFELNYEIIKPLNFSGLPTL